jgi:hypothetical protein
MSFLQTFFAGNLPYYIKRKRIKYEEKCSLIKECIEKGMRNLTKSKHEKERQWNVRKQTQQPHGKVKSLLQKQVLIQTKRKNNSIVKKLTHLLAFLMRYK